MSSKDPMRRFLVQISDTSGGLPHERTVEAAYWQIGATIDSHEPYRDNLVVFKDHDGKPVFAVRGDLVETITEIREPQDAIAVTGNVRVCMCSVVTGGHVVHRTGCPLYAPRTAVEEASA